jgi:phosphate transport system substrate-binding protein
VTRFSLVLGAATIAMACSSGADNSKKDSSAGAAAAPAAGAPATQSRSGAALTGAGATFPNPIYSKWFDTYATKTGVKINYQSIGSGGGISQLSAQTVDFGASDAPMTDEEMSKAKGGPIQHIPTVLGAVCLTYNLPEVTQTLNFTGDLIADMFLGKITKWNDPRIAALNKGVQLPNRDIVVVHRSDGSGTSYIFTDYLSSVSPTWKTAPGKGKDVAWPVGLGAKGNEGVTGQVKQTPGALGYVELAYARQNKLPTAAIRNASGQFMQPSIQAVTAAAAGAIAKLPATTDYRISIVNAPGAQSYPISSFTWILVYKNMPNAEKGKQLMDFLHWALHNGEQLAPTLDYAPLPPVLITRLDSTLATMKVGATS